jgi:serine protease Do
MLGLGGAGLGAVAVSAPVFHDLDEMIASPQSELRRPWYVKEVDKPTVEIDWKNMARFDISRGSGSGVILRSDGYILTAKHVVEGAQSVTVTLENRQTYSVSGIWEDDITDLAVVKIDVANLSTIPFADPETIQVGDWVIAVGHALGISPLEGGATVSLGIVSNVTQSFSIDTTAYYDVIQTDAAINPGNSGGPLVNMKGELVGINVAGAGDAQNISYAINVATAQHVYQDLVQFGHPGHAYLGVSLHDYDACMIGGPCWGAVITDIEKNGPADKAGLEINDDILSVDQYPVYTSADLLRKLWGQYEIGGKMHIVFWRNGVQMSADVTLGQRPSVSPLI